MQTDITDFIRKLAPILVNQPDFFTMSLDKRLTSLINLVENKSIFRIMKSNQKEAKCFIVKFLNDDPDCLQKITKNKVGMQLMVSDEDMENAVMSAKENLRLAQVELTRSQTNYYNAMEALDKIEENKKMRVTKEMAAREDANEKLEKEKIAKERAARESAARENKLNAMTNAKLYMNRLQLLFKPASQDQDNSFTRVINIINADDYLFIEFRCPFTGALITSDVLGLLKSNGKYQYFNDDKINDWLKIKKVNPMTNAPLERHQLNALTNQYRKEVLDIIKTELKNKDKLDEDGTKEIIKMICAEYKWDYPEEQKVLGFAKK